MPLPQTGFDKTFGIAGLKNDGAHFLQLEELRNRNRRKSESIDFSDAHLPELDPTGMPFRTVGLKSDGTRPG